MTARQNPALEEDILEEDNLENDILEEDIQRIVSDGLDIGPLCHSTVMVTGATGLIGSMAIRALLAYNEEKGADIRIVAAVRDLEKSKRVFEGADSAKLEFLVQDIQEEIGFAGAVDYIIHGASVTASRDFVEKPVETISTAIRGTVSVLEFARRKNVKGMVYLSSLEVYGVPGGRDGIKEDEYGYIDHLNVRSSYSEGKRMAECICKSYCSEYQVPVRIARLAQTFGSGVVYDDPRVFAEFSRCVIEKRDIILHTDGSTTRNYCDTADAVTALLYILLKGGDGEAYNVANENTAISIKDMALLAAGKSDKTAVKICIEEDTAKYGYNPTAVVCLDVGKLKALGFLPRAGLGQMFDKAIESMKLKRG